ncbi:hypothetical protein N9023_02160 [Opitutaceae bacterium]|nr:hypothetical protein [Opitutaceae bacterium]
MFHRVKLLLSVFSTAALLPISAQTEPIPTAEPVPDTGVEYRLFVGLDIEVGKDDDYALVEGYVNNRVHTDGSDKLVSLRNVDDMRFTHKTKLSRNPLTIANLHAEQISANVHAARDAMRNQQALDAYRDSQLETLQDQLRSSMVENESTNDAPAPASMIPSDEVPAGAGADNAAINSFQNMTDGLTNNSTFTDELVGNKDAGTAMLITAEISSPNRIDDAYIVGTASISTNESPEEQVIFFSRVGKLDEKPRRVRIVKQGMPGEFKIRDVKMHVYRNGQELVSDQSDKQYALTREQAYQYLTLERVSRNRGKTIDPEPAWSLAPPELFAAAKKSEFDYPLTVHVDAHGKVTGIDPNKFVPEKVLKIVMELPFFPGLIDGEAVDSTALVNLASFFR